MRICLVSMPWHLLETPCLPVGLLHARIGACRERHEVADYYGNLRWAEFLGERTAGEISSADYAYVADRGIWHAMGDWIFASALHDDPRWQEETFRAYLDRRGLDPGTSVRMREHAQEFCDLAAAEILAREPDLVGFSSTFQQNVASLSVARRIKRLRPATKIVFGGGNCDGPMGPALHRGFPFLDYVISGEGEIAFVALVDALAAGRRLDDVPGLAHRGDGGETVVNGRAGMVPIDLIPQPDYTEWWQAIQASPLRGELTPVLIYEAARGCWWGEKHHCTFCGLNGTSMKFRSKPAPRVRDELAELVRTYEILDVVTVDNILDTAYFRDLLPRLRDLGWDLRLRYEVKANLQPEQLDLLRDAGVCHIQPGIESLNSQVLRLMDKGVHGTQNVRLLRDANDRDLTVDWNYLYGFPGETAADYRPVIGQFPALVHLQPPSGITRILIERFSPHFERPELGFAERRPAEMYRHVYDLDPAELEDLAYQFESAPQGIGGATEEALRSGVAAWQRDHLDSALTWQADGDDIVVFDRRTGFPRQEHIVGGAARVRAYRLLERPRTLPGLGRELASAGLALAEDTLARWLGGLRDAGLVFEDGGRIVALATRRPSLRARDGLPADDWLIEAGAEPADTGRPVAASGTRAG